MLKTFMDLLSTFIGAAAPAIGGSVDGLNAMSTDTYSTGGAN
ncbi:hypothetical protein [Prescottella agglutinans]